MIFETILSKQHCKQIKINSYDNRKKKSWKHQSRI